MLKHVYVNTYIKYSQRSKKGGVNIIKIITFYIS